MNIKSILIIIPFLTIPVAIIIFAIVGASVLFYGNPTDSSSTCFIGEMESRGIFVPLIWIDTHELELNNSSNSIQLCSVDKNGEMLIIVTDTMSVKGRIINLPRYAENGESKLVEDYNILKDRATFYVDKNQQLQLEIERLRNERGDLN